MNVNEPSVEIEEVISVLRAASGVSIEQALLDAQLCGYSKLEIFPDHAEITWYRKNIWRT